MVIEVLTHTREKLLITHIRLQLLQHRRTLGVRNAVEILLRRLNIRRIRSNRVRRRQLILRIRPRLLHRGKRRPRLRILTDTHLRRRRRPRSKRLIEPQIVPPLHRDKIAEPHMRHLMQNRIVATLQTIRRRLRRENVLIAVRHTTNVLHRAHVVLRAKHLIVLVAKRVLAAEIRVVEIEAVLRLTEQSLRIHMRNQTGTRVQTKLNRAAITRVVRVGDLLKLTRANRNQVCRQRVINRRGPGRGAVTVFLA